MTSGASVLADEHLEAALERVGARRAAVSDDRSTSHAVRIGIFLGMISPHLSSDQVLDGLGGKVVDAFGAAVVGARGDLAAYRELLPSVVADHSDRGLLSWLHDRAWRHLRGELDGVPGVSFVDKPPVRDLWVGTGFRCRVKKHDIAGLVRTYPTRAALDFMAQPEQPTIDGFGIIALCAGYIWDPADREVGPAVLSLRDGVDNLIWMHRLAEPDAGNPAASIRPILPPVTPRPPVVDVPSAHRDDAAPER